MMNSDVAMSTIVIYAMWTASGSLITASWFFNESAIGQFGIMATAIAATMTIVRDNNRTRRLVRRHAGDRARQRT